MIRSIVLATAALVAVGSAQGAGASEAAYCPPKHRHHVAAAHRWPPHVVYGRVGVPPVTRHVYNYEDNGRYDGADVPPPVGPGQPASWLDGYGTRPYTYAGYGTYNTYGGSSQVWPAPIPPAGGLAVYSPGAYGPGPRIISIPGY